MANPLTDILPPKARKVAYAVLFVLGIVFSCFQAAQGDWMVFIGGVFTALLGLLAAGNTPPARGAKQNMP